MNAKQPQPARQTNLLRLVLPALAAAIAVLASSTFSSFDHIISTFFALKVNGNNNVHWLVLPTVAISFLSFEAAVRVKSRFLIFVFLQVSALGVLLAWLTAQLAGCASVLASLLASTVSFALGLTARELKSAAEKQTSRYFELVIKNAELDQTRLALLKQDEADRRILASDLHDQVLNEIKQIKSKVIALSDTPTIEKDSIASIEQSLDTAGRHIRDVMESLFPSVLENLGLCSALDQLTRDCCHKSGLQGRFLKSNRR
jgi:signal transduction histidine kinase